MSAERTEGDSSGAGAQASGGVIVEFFKTPGLAAETRPLPAAVDADLNLFASYLEGLSAAAKANPDGPEARGLERVRSQISTGTGPQGIGELLVAVSTGVAAERDSAIESSLRG